MLVDLEERSNVEPTNLYISPQTLEVMSRVSAVLVFEIAATIGGTGSNDSVPLVRDNLLEDEFLANEIMLKTHELDLLS